MLELGEGEGEEKKSQIFFSQHHLALCSVDQMLPFIQEKRLEEVFPWKDEFLGGDEQYYSPYRKRQEATFTMHLWWVKPSRLGHSNRQTSQHQPRCWSGQTHSCHWNLIHSSLHSVHICLVNQGSSSLLWVPANSVLTVFKFSERSVRKKAHS